MVRLLSLHDAKKISTSEWEEFESLMVNNNVDEESPSWIEGMSQYLVKYTARNLGLKEIKQLIHAVSQKARSPS